MTQEDKNILLKDLCARLLYGIKGLHRGKVHDLFTIDGREADNACIQVDGYDAWFSVDTFKPYLRPLSSITEQEMRELYDIPRTVDKENVGYWHKFSFTNHEFVDYLNRHHFDYRGLIEKGLAIEITKENNPYV